MQPEFREIETKWQRKWEEEKIFQPEPSEKAKFFITIPYPYLNGNLHAGHTRTFTIGDAFARFMRMKGYNVLFPMGFHVTGTPIIGLAELIQKKDENTIKVYNKYHDVPDNVLIQLNTPEKIVEYFSKEALQAMKSIGYSIDWRRIFTTTDETYQKFIEWQFHRLKEMGYVVKGSHPVRYCPNDRNPVEDHDLLHGENATVVDFTVIKFYYEDDGERVILPCATLRPETVFGVTNIWLKPEEYILAKVNGEKWVVSEEAYEKLKYTDKTIEFEGKINAEELFGRFAVNPVTNKKIPIFPADFVDPDNATGVVMSVPAHAPYDYVALQELKKSEYAKKYNLDEILDKIEPVVLIKIEDDDGGEVPAEKIVKEMKIKSQNDPSLEKATKILYKREFHRGILLEVTKEYKGTKVSQIKDKLQKDLIDRGIGDIFYEFSEKPVVCRCGTKCVVKVVKDQWFLNYSNPDWKNKVLKHLEKMKIIPDYYKEEFRNKIEWLKDKACARRKGLGTRIPWDKEWLIESLSDSTIYMSYYILAKYVNSGELKAENMTKELLDYVLLGKGNVEEVSRNSGLDVNLIEKIRNDFVYWYPVDIRSSGKDLVANHLLFFLFHHIAIFPEEYWPKAIAVNGYVSLEGKKMSKSKGPLLTMKRAVIENGADVTRMYILSTSEYDSDADWRRKDVESLSNHLRRFYELIVQNYDKFEKTTMLDRWLISRFQRVVKETTIAMENFQTRRAVNSAFFEMMADVRWYLRRGGKNLAIIIDEWLKLLTPFIPHICEELWHLKHDTFISLEKYPEYREDLVDETAETSEEYLKKLIYDIKEILKFVKAKKVYIALAEEWKYEIYGLVKDEKDAKNAIKKVMENEKFRKMGKDVTNFIKNLLKEKLDGMVDEKKIILDNLEFIKREAGVEIELNAQKVPESKRKVSIPGKPAIYAVQ